MKLFTLLLLASTLAFGAIDINKAGSKKLQTLKGIGASKAEAIIAHRKKTCFTSVDALSDVKGIGAKTVEKNRDNLKASKCRAKKKKKK